MKKTCLAAAMAAALSLGANAAHALNIVFDYSLDTTGFFTTDKRATLDQVASIFENNITTHLAALTHLNLQSSDMNGYAGTSISVTNQSIAADTLRVYVDAVDLTGNTVGLAWVGTAYPSRVNHSVNGFSSGWGGQILFDTRAWYVDADIRTTEAFSQLDFASVAMHEMGHMFGLDHSANSADSMAPNISSGTRQLFTANDWTAMRAEGWAVTSLTPNLNAVVEVPSPVPEPSSYAMLLAGLAGLGAITRRRAQR